MSDIDKKSEFNLELINLREPIKEDQQWIYNLVNDFLKTDLSVMFLKMPSLEEFFQIDIKRYMITDGDNTLGFVQILKNNEIGYFLDPKYGGKGIATKAVELLMEKHPADKYFATIHDKNIPSINLVKRLGFNPKATIYEKIN